MDLGRELRHKAAGHGGTLTDKDELLVFKPTIPQEVEFYEELQRRRQRQVRSCENTKGDVPLYRWIPAYLGTLQEGSKTVAARCDEEKSFIVLENLLHGFSKPNILDIKLGKILYDPNTASKEKIKRLQRVSESTTSGSLGFRICGMNIVGNELMLSRLDSTYYEQDPNDKSYYCVNKVYGREIESGKIAEAFEIFFACDTLSPARRAKLVRMFWQRLQLLYNTLLDEEVRLISSSLLFVYETDASRWDAFCDNDRMLRDDLADGEEEEEEDDDDDRSQAQVSAPLSSLSLIDFARSAFAPAGAGYDENVLQGVEGLLDVFAALDGRLSGV